MGFEEKEEQKLDLFVLLNDFLQEAKRLWILGLVLVVLCTAGMTGYRYHTYEPRYQATASFTIRVGNPLYASVNSYNADTAKQMAKTFPYILTSGVLQERVMEHLGISYMPEVSVSVLPNSSILTMGVQASDPQLAYDVLNAVITYYPEVAEFVVGSTEMVLLDESGVPTQPINSLDLNGAVKSGALIGAAVWVVLVGILALTKNTIHNEEELKQVLNFPFTCQMPVVKVSGKAACPLITTAKKQPGFVESVRLLRIRVEKAMEEGEKKILLVTSAIPSEGKTMVSVNLALSLAQKGKRVLLIDCDLRNPSVTKALKMSNRSGLAEYLSGKISIKEMICPTDEENLFVIAGGEGNNTSYSKLYSQENTVRLVRAAKKLFDYVILDTPPCSMLADAAEVAELAECGLMVIRQDHASREQIMDGVQTLGDGDLQLLGCVFNGVRRSLSSGYGYGYGYGYGKKSK